MSFKEETSSFKVTTEKGTDSLSTQGLVMVKPHAKTKGLDHVVESILKFDEHSLSLYECGHLLSTLACINFKGTVVRDLRRTSSGSDLIDLFYGDKQTRRYYPYIREWYLGSVVFFAFDISSEEKDLGTHLDTLKGQTATFDKNGITIDRPSGIRGIIGNPYLVYEPESLAKMSETDYVKAIEPVIQNYIHVCDKPGEAQTALSLLGV